VAWCYGALGGYLDLYDRVIPEVTRIEGAYQKPGESLSEDMKTYSDMRTEGRRDMKLFARAIQAAEKASMQPISARGAAAIQKGRSSWAPAGNLSDRMVAQQWMGWTLPERCVSTAASLEKRAKLLGATFRSEEPQPDPAVSEAPPPEAPPPESIPAEPAQPTQTPVEPPPTFS